MDGLSKPLCTLAMCRNAMNRLTVLSAFISIVVVLHRPPNAFAASDLTRRSPAGATDRPPPSADAENEDKAEYSDEEVLEEPSVGVVLPCSDYESEGTDRYYLRELIENVDGGEHVIINTHYGALSGIRINGMPAAG